MCSQENRPVGLSGAWIEVFTSYSCIVFFGKSILSIHAVDISIILDGYFWLYSSGAVLDIRYFTGLSYIENSAISCVWRGLPFNNLMFSKAFNSYCAN